MEGHKQSTSAKDGWPLIKYQFEVEISGGLGLGSATIYAQSVEGMEMEVDVYEYRHGNMSNHHVVKVPGMKSYSNVTIKKGVFKDDNTFFTWLNDVNMNTTDRSTILIKMLDADNDTPLLTWKLLNAIPVKFVPSDLSAEDDSDPAIEELEFTFESFELG
ncbi:MAG: phage tail-like protein [Maribacter sp.]|jgi:phage tail-like protein